MITSLDDLRELLSAVFGDSIRPRPLDLVEPVALLHGGAGTPQEFARQARTTVKRLRALADSLHPLADLLGTEISPPPAELERRVRGVLGQLLLGRLAEAVFEDMYRINVGTSELRLMDDRSTRGDTDYLVFNGLGRQVFRMNIKFHGSLFRKAKELVGLEPEDCFALATYKIYAALRRQETEHLPYIFVVVGVPGLTGLRVGEAIPGDLIHLSALPHQCPRLSGKRTIEDRIVDQLATSPSSFGVEEAVESFETQIRAAEWYVLSARRADNLLRDRLFERAYALRVRGFARNYGRAELDMHFSLTEDLRPLADFLAVLREHGMPGLVSRLERGTL